MKILLINPSHSAVYDKLTPPEHPPLGLGYLAAVLDPGRHDVRVMDVGALNLDRRSLAHAIKSATPELVGITATTPMISAALDIAEIVKENSAAQIVLGGVHPTLMPMECASNEYVDFVVAGEGEVTFAELVTCLETGGSLSEIEGLVYKHAGRIIQNRNRALIEDLDLLPFPARHLFSHYAYRFPDALGHPAFPIITSRGCPGRCTFCSAQHLHGRKFRYRSADNILDEIEFLIQEYGAEEIHIWDDNFITNSRRVYEFRDRVVKRGIRVLFSFPNGVRADFINYEIVKALRDFGTYSLAIGVESGNQRILDGVRKGMGLEQIEKAFMLCSKMGIETWGFFILGLPGEDAQTIGDTIDFALKTNPRIAKFHILKPYPKSEVFDELKSEGLIIDEDYSHYGIHAAPVHRLPALSADDLVQWQKRAYRRFYLRRSKLVEMVAGVRSFNRFRFNVRVGLSLLWHKVR